MSLPPEIIRPPARDRHGPVPPLGLLLPGAFDLAAVTALKNREHTPVHLVFPVGSSREAANLTHLLSLVAPLVGLLVDRVWLAYGGSGRPGALTRLARSYPWLELCETGRTPPPDHPPGCRGKGAAMRAMLYHLIHQVGVTHPRAVVLFLDADIRPAYFSARWVVDAVGAVLWFPAVEAAKIVYHRPRGGRLNALLRAFLAQCPGQEVQQLQKLVYLLSGEMAGTLKFWTSLPFQAGYGMEILTLLSLAFNRLHLQPGTPDLAHLVQAYVGRMDHRHAPVASTRHRRGLDQMAGTIFHCLLSFLQETGMLTWNPTARPANPAVTLPLPPGEDGQAPEWLRAPVADATLPPLRTLPHIRAAVSR